MEVTDTSGSSSTSKSSKFTRKSTKESTYSCDSSPVISPREDVSSSGNNEIRRGRSNSIASRAIKRLSGKFTKSSSKNELTDDESSVSNVISNDDESSSPKSNKHDDPHSQHPASSPSSKEKKDKRGKEVKQQPHDAMHEELRVIRACMSLFQQDITQLVTYRQESDKLTIELKQILQRVETLENRVYDKKSSYPPSSRNKNTNTSVFTGETDEDVTVKPDTNSNCCIIQ